MKRAIASARYLALAGVVFGLIGALAAFTWAGLKTAMLVIKLGHGEVEGIAVSEVQLMDGLLIASGLLILAFGLYELFVGELELPGWLTIKDLDALKGKLAGIIVIVMAVAFLERLESPDSRNLLESGIGTALVSATLVWMSRKKRED